jgi:hypothetical protein
MRQPRAKHVLTLVGGVLIGSLLLSGLAGGSLSSQGSGAAKQLPLESPDGLRLHNLSAAPATLDGKKGIRVTISDEAVKKLSGATPDQQAQVEQLAIVDGVEFGNGVIEAELTGAPAPNAPEGARGFVGLAFRVQPDMRTYDAFYLRPTNGRAEDQERRNHAVQYIAHPDWPWFRLRKETPSKYEAYVDLQPNVWTRIRIDVRGDKARLFVHGQEHPTLIVNDVKSGANGKGAVALWLDRGTVAHFRNVSIQPAP